MITEKLISETTIELLRRTGITLPRSVKEALQKALLIEDGEAAKQHLKTIIENISIAETRQIPVCQDTGVPILFVKVGRGLSFPGGFEKALKDGTARATKIIPLRENVIHPLTKENLGTNTGWGMPFVHYEMIEGDYIEITSLLKGFGSEAKTSLAYIPTSEDVDKGIIKFVLDCCRKALGEPCPPYIIGIGLGGSSDIASMLSKKAFLRLPIGKPNQDPDARSLEEKIFKAVNATGIGPMGMGGKTTALAVHIEICGTHTAAVPTVVSFQCWADRQATVRIDSAGRVQFVEEG